MGSDCGHRCIITGWKISLGLHISPGKSTACILNLDIEKLENLFHLQISGFALDIHRVAGREILGDGKGGDSLGEDKSLDRVPGQFQAVAVVLPIAEYKAVKAKLLQGPP